MAILKIVQTVILMTVSKSCCFNKDQRTVVTKQKKILESLFLACYYSSSKLVSCRLCFEEKEKILRFRFGFEFFLVLFCFFVLSCFFFLIPPTLSPCIPSGP